MKRSIVICFGTLLLISSLVLTGCCCPWFAPTPSPTSSPTPKSQVRKAQSPDGEVVISGTAPGIGDIKSVDPIPASETKQLVQQHCPGTPLSDVLKGVDVEPSGLTLSPAATILFYIGTGHGYEAYDRLTILTIPGCEKGDAQVRADIRWAEGKIGHTSIFALVKLRPEEETVVVPEVVRKHVDEAMEIILAADLQVGQMESRVSDQEPDTVIWQDPEPGTEVAPGTLVELVVAVPPEAVVVPNVIGRNQEEATAMIYEAELEAGEVFEEEVPDQEPGTVIWQDPEPGTEVAPGTQVELVVAVPPGVVVVPNVIGRNQEEATAMIYEAGLEVGEVFEEEVPDQEPDTVIWQDPEPGTEVAPGMPIELVVAQPPEPETPPPAGLTEQEKDLLREGIVGIEVLDDYTLMIELAEADDRIPELIGRWADSEGFGFEWWEVSEDGLRYTLGLREGERLSYDFEEALRAALE